MGMDVGGNKGGPKSEINVTPLVDVMLVLLIIFMILQPMLQMGYDVNVPPNTPSNVLPQANPEQIIVSLTANNEIYLNKERVERSNLPIRLQEVLRNRGKKPVFFSCEDTVKYDDAMRLMDVVRNNGAENIGIVMDWVNPLEQVAPAGS
ncbi:MAG TPA: biopolymer transporter ExbD [Thermoanaerobaculia bacterium]|nr:biopolymer transporter ExbD [Thermoanaerobaculia bacterium]HQP86917.1 biopolymer transporter ExbD [Thermoanaerobaculia bacterium]